MKGGWARAGRPGGGAGVWAAVVGLALGAGAGCVEERVVRYRPILGGLPGAETGMPVTPLHTGATDPSVVPGDELVITNQDGSKTLRARTARHLMVHIYRTLQENDEALFLEQVLSERTKDEYYARGLHPREAFRALKERQEDIGRLFDAMPMGEYTPGLFLRSVGGGAQRLEVQGPVARDLPWTGLDMVMEKGNFRLRWFVTPE